MRDAKVKREGMRGVGAWGWMRLTCGMRFVGVLILPWQAEPS